MCNLLITILLRYFNKPFQQYVPSNVYGNWVKTRLKNKTLNQDQNMTKTEPLPIYKLHAFLFYVNLSQMKSLLILRCIVQPWWISSSIYWLISTLVTHNTGLLRALELLFHLQRHLTETGCEEPIFIHLKLLCCSWRWAETCLVFSKDAALSRQRVCQLCSMILSIDMLTLNVKWMKCKIMYV